MEGGPIPARSEGCFVLFCDYKPPLCPRTSQGGKETSSFTSGSLLYQDQRNSSKFLTFKSGLASLVYLCMWPQSSNESNMCPKKLDKRTPVCSQSLLNRIYGVLLAGVKGTAAQVRWLKRRSWAHRGKILERLYPLGKLMEDNTRVLKARSMFL